MSENIRSPDVSVVIPTHNRVTYLRNALTHCFEGNDDIDVEAIVVNDGSTDGTREFLEQLDDPRVRAIHQSSQGAQVARNAGMAEATGRYVKFLDDDDWLEPGALQDEVARLDDTGADVCHGRVRQHIEEMGTSWVVQEEPGDDIVVTVLTERMWTIPHKYLFRRASVTDLRWDPDLPYHQDYAYLVEAACRGLRFVGLDRVVGVNRSHDGPRIGNVKASAAPTDYYTQKVELIKRGVQLLEENDLIRPRHRRAAAAGIWNWAHIVAGYNLDAFQAFYDDIRKLDSGFTPERSLGMLRALDYWVGPKGTEQMLYPVRRLKNALT